MLSAPKLITPNVCSYTELTVGKECWKRPLCIIVTVAAKVTDRSLRSPKWRVAKGHTCGEGRTGDQRGVPCHARHAQFKAGGSWGSRSSSSMAAFWRGSCLLFYLWFWYRFRSVHSWVQSLSTAEASLALPGAARQLLAGCQRPAPSFGKLSVSFVYFALFLLILLVLLVLLVKLFIFNL